MWVRLKERGGMSRNMTVVLTEYQRDTKFHFHFELSKLSAKEINMIQYNILVFGRVRTQRAKRRTSSPRGRAVCR